jgi:DNA polymerase III sliding clamp (beta) subunit (PCNA family)
MCSYQTERVGLLKNIIDSMSKVVTETNIFLREDGIFIQGMDSSNISLVALEIESSFFTSQ